MTALQTKAEDGVNAEQVMAIKIALKEAGAQAEIVSKFKGTINRQRMKPSPLS
ncbi:hypothetical protein [Nostoc sp. LPT]|uniref:hypothetical protein n=1 Tax=Nostoc sp. LPT TaxID=2815387 RepID=UPI001D4CC720|nr:hypothetical protein [Nostoc sp. LPT]MBN4000927.1 hypothetical protein [Nostoc sp. LPT]